MASVKKQNQKLRHLIVRKKKPPGNAYPRVRWYKYTRFVKKKKRKKKKETSPILYDNFYVFSFFVVVVIVVTLLLCPTDGF